MDLKLFNKLFKKTGKAEPKRREIYACGTGTYVGEMLVFCKKDADNYHFLSIPKNINRTVPIDKFDWALTNKVIEFAHYLPADVYKTCFKQFEYNEKAAKPKEDKLK